VERAAGGLKLTDLNAKLFEVGVDKLLCRDDLGDALIEEMVVLLRGGKLSPGSHKLVVGVERVERVVDDIVHDGKGCPLSGAGWLGLLSVDDGFEGGDALVEVLNSENSRIVNADHLGHVFEGVNLRVALPEHLDHGIVEFSDHVVDLLMGDDFGWLDVGHVCGVCLVWVWFSGWKLLGGLDHGDDGLHELSVSRILLVVDEVLADVSKADVELDLNIVADTGAPVLALNGGYLGVRNKGGEDGGIGLQASLLGVHSGLSRAMPSKLSGGQRGRSIDVGREVMAEILGEELNKALSGGLRVDRAALIALNAAGRSFAGALAFRDIAIPRALGVGIREDVVGAIADAVDSAVGAGACAEDRHDDVAGLVKGGERVLGKRNHVINPTKLAGGDEMLTGEVSDIGLGGGNLSLVSVDGLVAALAEDHAERGLLMGASVVAVVVLGDLDGGLIAGLGEFGGNGADEGIIAFGGDVVLFDGVAHVCYWVRRSLSLCVHSRATPI